MNTFSLNKSIINLEKVNTDEKTKEKPEKIETIYDLVNKLISIKTESLKKNLNEIQIDNLYGVQKSKPVEDDFFEEDNIEEIKPVDDVSTYNTNQSNDIKIKKKMVFISSGSNGTVVQEENCDDIVYKITMLTDDNEFVYQSYVELIYLNYFKINYPEYVDCDYFPVQNIDTIITTLKDLKEEFELDSQTLNRLRYNYIKDDDDIIIINIMKNYRKNLFELSSIKRIEILENFDSIVKKILHGLNFIHSNLLIHGDVKTSNILMLENQCKIIDFGGIKYVGSKFYDRTCTLTSRSPEELNYEYGKVSKPIYFPNYGFKSEIWSLGIVLTELLIGVNPLSQLYNELLISAVGNTAEEVERDVESKLSNILNSRTHIEIGNNILRRKGLNKFESYVPKIERMLLVDYVHRYSNLQEIYFDLFGELLSCPIKTQIEHHYKIETNYLELFQKFRKNNYNLLVELMLLTKNLNCLPLGVWILDKYCLKLLELKDENFIKFLLEENEILIQIDKILIFLSIIIITSSLINREQIIYKELFSILNNYDLKVELSVRDIPSIKNSIIDITQLLNYDLINNEYVFVKGTESSKIMQVYYDLYNKIFYTF